ncbi:MAG: tRNA-dihydrouridine synthase [Acidobacteria bacterium]|nr:tRNA-dihydrouridine synthase [Acidobacteriota bacterium]
MFDTTFPLGRKTVRGRFVIPSGIRCTRAATIHKCFQEVTAVGVVTTKSISAQPRAGYREPIYARYAPGCYINAVGLANPGARAYRAEFDGLEIPPDKFLLVSIFGSDLESFLEAAVTLKPIADGFELNMSCPHAKGFGAEVGQDRELLKSITAAVVQATGVPVFVKLSSTLPDLAGAASAALAAGATGLTLINTVGPALAAVGRDAILSNRLGGLSGDGIRPMGLRAVEQVRKAVGGGPVIIGMGGIASPEHVAQYARAGANLFGVGSALTGLDSREFQHYLAQLERDCSRAEMVLGYERSCDSTARMDYLRTRVAARADYDESLFKLILDKLPGDYRDGELAGTFMFLCLPGVGEKPFAVFSATEKSIVVRAVGQFTRALAGLSAGSEILVRGPYGCGLPKIGPGTVVHTGGGTGIASLLEIASRLAPDHAQVFLLGARTRVHLCDLEKFERLGPVHLATDDGSLGHHGCVPDLLGEVASKLGNEPLTFINCGPEPMVRRCFEIQREFTSEDRLIGSIEYMTSCGVGICGKCASPSGALTCVDGPFLPWREFEQR